MQEGMSLMYSWDPRARKWMKEHAEHSAPPPPSEPIDLEAVQTVYLDTQNGLWTPTILGDVGRRIASELGEKYLSPAVAGLAMEQKAISRKPVVHTPDQIRRIPAFAWLIGIAVAIGVAAWASMAPLPPAPIALP